MRSWICLIISSTVALAVHSPLHQTAAQTDCPGAPPPRLIVEMQARVIVQGEGLEGLLRVRDNPGVTSDALVDMKNGDTFSVIGGPECVDSYWWWNIVTSGGITGWSAEGTLQNYFVEPLADPNPNPLPAAPDRLVARLGNGSAYSATWSPDGQILAIASSRGVWLYTPDLEPIQLLEGPSMAEVAWSPDGTRLVGAAADGGLPIWEVTTRQLVLRIPAHTAPVRAVSWSADGLSLASVSGEPLVRVWDAATGAPQKTLDLPGEAGSVRWNPVANQLAASHASQDEWGNPEFGVQVWEAESFAPICQIDTLVYPHIRWSADGTQVAGLHRVLSFVIVTVSDGTQTFSMTNLGVGGHSNLADFAWTPDGGFVLGSSYMSAETAANYVERGNPAGGFLRHEMSYGRAIRSLAWRPGSNQLAMIDACFLSLLDGDTLTPLKQNEDFLYPNFAWDETGQPTLAASPSEPQLTVTVDPEQPSLRVQDTATGQLLVEIVDGCFMNRDFVYEFSPDESHIAVSCPYAYSIPVWEIATGEQSAVLLHSELSCAPDWGAQMCWIGWSATGRYIYLTGYGIHQQQTYLLIWDVQTGENVLDQAVTGETILWSGDDRYIANPGLDRLTIWDASTWQSWESSLVVDPPPYRWRLTWSPDGTRLASAGNTEQNTVIIWDAPAARSWRELSGHTSSITSLSWSPDGTRLASGDFGGTVRIWDVVSGQLLLTLPGHQGQVWYFYWKPDGSQLAVVSEDRTARVWDLR